MELTYRSAVKYTAILLLLTAISQPAYTVLKNFAPEVNRQFLWGIEGLLFVLMTAFAGSALVLAKRYTLGFSAIAFSAVLNVAQVGVGYTQFDPFREAAQANADLGAISFSIYALSFFLYNAARVLLGLATIVFGMAKMNEGGKLLGGSAILVGVVALVTNALVMMFGIQGFMPRPIAGTSGFLATLLLALCMFRLDDKR